MKNRIQIYATAACCMAAVLFTGCEKEQQHQALKVSIEGVSSTSTAKVHLEDFYPCFIVGDQIKVNATTYSSEGKGKACDFYADGDDAEAPFYAVYPSTCVSGTVSAQPSVILPEVQQYEEEKGVQKLEAPMGGANQNPEIRMHNFCSVLEVVVKNPGTATAPMTVSSIEVSSPSVKMSYPDGLQLATAMNKDNPDNVQALVATGTYTKANDSDPDQGGVTLTIPSANGTIAVGNTKSFMIYLPTYKSGDGSKVLLHVKVTTAETGCIASYTRSVRLDSLQRNLIYHYNFSLAPAIRKVEEWFFNLGSESSPDYISFTKHNEGAADQKTLGTSASSYSPAENLLTSAEWNTLFAQTGKSGLVQCGSNYYWALLPPGFEYPEDCDAITAATANNSTYTVTVKDNFNDMSSVTVYTDSQWSQMEAAGAVFLPIGGTFPASPTEKSTVTQYTYYYVPGMANKLNMYFYFNAEYGEKDKKVVLKSFSIQAGVNKDKLENGNIYVRTIQHM